MTEIEEEALGEQSRRLTGTLYFGESRMSTWPPRHKSYPEMS